MRESKRDTHSQTERGYIQAFSRDIHNDKGKKRKGQKERRYMREIATERKWREREERKKQREKVREIERFKDR